MADIMPEEQERKLDTDPSQSARQALSSLAAHMRVRIEATALIVVGLIALLPGLRTIPLVDRDEPRFARATVEMMERGEWLIPYFNCDFRFDKPPLTYWLMRIGYLTAGINEAGARIHSVVAAIATALLLYWYGRSWFGARVGLLAGFVFLTMLQTLLHGRGAVADMPMIFCVTVCQFELYNLLRAEGPWRRSFALAYGAMALGFLAKGPIAVLVPVLSVVFYRILRGRRVQLRALRFLRGLILVAVLIGIWAIPALVATRGAFYQVGIGKHVIQRGLEAFNARKVIPAYYLPAAFFSLFPWIVFLPATLARIWQLWDDRRAWLLAWVLAPYVIFSFYATQLPHYVMPAFPAIALLVADTLPGATKWQQRRFDRAWSTGLTGLYLLGAAAIAALLFSAGNTAWRQMGLGVFLLVAGLLAVAFFCSSGWKRSAFASLSIVSVSFWLVGGALRRTVIATQLEPFFRSCPDSTEFAYYRFTEPSLVFYSGRCWQKLATPAQVNQFLNGGRNRVAVVLAASYDLDDWLKDRWRGTGGSRWKSYAAELAAIRSPACQTQMVSGVNLARSRLVKVAVLSRRLAPPPQE